MMWVPGILEQFPNPAAPLDSVSRWSRSIVDLGVLCCRAFRSSADECRRYIRCPDGLVVLMLAADGRFTVPAGTGRPMTSLLCGPHAHAVEIEITGVSLALCLYLSPWAAYRLLDRPMHELADRVVDLADVAVPLRDDLVERMTADPDPWRAVTAAEHLLSERVRRGRPCVDEVISAWRTLWRSAGAVSIGALAASVGLSERHLETRFREQVGSPPKRCARVLRVQRACGLLATGASVVDAATASGYHDQAHLCRDFKATTGRTPSAFSRAPLDMLLVREDDTAAPPPRRRCPRPQLSNVNPVIRDR
jgi:AraC-like DNA-binding protein